MAGFPVAVIRVWKKKNGVTKVCLLWVSKTGRVKQIGWWRKTGTKSKVVMTCSLKQRWPFLFRVTFPSLHRAFCLDMLIFFPSKFSYVNCSVYLKRLCRPWTQFSRHSHRHTVHGGVLSARRDPSRQELELLYGIFIFPCGCHSSRSLQKSTAGWENSLVVCPVSRFFHLTIEIVKCCSVIEVLRRIFSKTLFSVCLYFSGLRVWKANTR